jgi:PAS domain S-box-containing protein
MSEKKPSYLELEERIRELEKETFRAKNIAEELLEKRNKLKEQNIKLVKKSIELSEIKRELEDKNYELDLIRSELQKQNVDLIRKSIDLSDIMRQLEDKNYNLELSRADLEKTLAALQESEERYRVVAENALVGITTADKQENLTFSNPAFAEMLGYSREEIVQLNLSQLAGRDEFAKFRRQTKLRAKGLSNCYESRLIHKDGSFRSVLISASPIKRADGSYEATLAVVNDITERKRAEEALTESEEKFRNFVETSADLVFLLDRTGCIQYVSPMVKNLYGYSAGELIGKHLNTTTPLKEVPKALKALKTVLDGKSLRNFEVNQKTKNGKIVPMEVNALPVEKHGKIVGLQGIMRDITERKHMEEQIRKSLKEKEVLLKEIHHRVKNNMQIISSLLNLQEPYIKDKSVRAAFRESRNRIRSMSLIHEKMYQSEDLEKVDIREYIESLTNDLFITYDVSPEIISLENNVDDIYLKLDTAIPCCLLINELVSNSLKHGFPKGKSGEIIIDFSSEKGKYCLRIKDSGVGFPEGFDYRKTDTLGFQLVPMFVKKLHGTMEIGSRGGAEIRIRFKA